MAIECFSAGKNTLYKLKGLKGKCNIIIYLIVYDLIKIYDLFF